MVSNQEKTKRSLKSTIKEEQRLKELLVETLPFPGEWPWQVLLQWENRTAIYKAMHNKTFCGGGILSKHFVLTAAHFKLSGKFNILTIIIYSEMKIISNIF